MDPRLGRVETKETNVLEDKEERRGALEYIQNMIENAAVRVAATNVGIEEEESFKSRRKVTQKMERAAAGCKEPIKRKKHCANNRDRRGGSTGRR